MCRVSGLEAWYVLAGADEDSGGVKASAAVAASSSSSVALALFMQ